MASKLAATSVIAGVTQETQRDTAHLWAPKLSGAFVRGVFEIHGKSRPEFEKHVPNQPKEVRDKLSWRSTSHTLA